MTKGKVFFDKMAEGEKCEKLDFRKILQGRKGQFFLKPDL